MGRIVFGLVLTGLWLIYDAYTQVVDFCKRGYMDNELTDKVWDAIISFTIGFFLVAGVVYFVIWIIQIIDWDA